MGGRPLSGLPASRSANPEPGRNRRGATRHHARSPLPAARTSTKPIRSCHRDSEAGAPPRRPLRQYPHDRPRLPGAASPARRRPAGVWRGSEMARVNPCNPLRASTGTPGGHRAGRVLELHRTGARRNTRGSSRTSRLAVPAPQAKALYRRWLRHEYGSPSLHPTHPNRAARQQNPQPAGRAPAARSRNTTRDCCSGASPRYPPHRPQDACQRRPGRYCCSCPG